MCKMAHFGNCDPETVDQESCIFHKPNKSEEEAVEFYQKFLKRFKPRVEEIEVGGKKIKRLVFEEPVDARGFVFPKVFENDKVVLKYPDPKTGLKWVGKFPFKHAVFKKGASFSGATFEGVVSFYGATFEGNVDFNNTTFEEYVSFDRVVFKGVARFDRAKFKNVEGIFDPNDSNQQRRFWEEVSPEVRVGHMDPLKPEGQKTGANGSCLNCFYRFSVTFINSEFRDRVSFNSAEFCGAVRFNFSKFGGNVEGESLGPIDFEEAKFLGPSTEFFKCTFFAEISFLKTEFWGYVDFSKSTFGQLLFFDHSEFLVDVESEDIGDFGFSPVNFRRTHFKKDVSFRGVEFYSKPNFSKAHFEDSVLFTEADTKKCIFHRGAEFVECTFEKEANFQGCVFRRSNITIISPNYKYPQTSFACSTFKGVVHFEFAEFGKVIFNYAIFEDGANFNNAKFYDEAWFKEVEFKKTVEFKATEFKGDVWFNGSVFERLIVFVEEPENKNNKDTSTDVQLPKFWRGLSFSNCDFRQGIKLITDEKDHEERNLNTGDYVKHLIKSALALDNPLIRRFLSMFVREERDTTYYEAIKEAARVQRLSFEKEGKKENADSMFLIEMRAIRELRRLKSRRFLLFEYFLELVLGDWIALYGTKGRRILLWSVVVVTWFATAYTLTLLNPIWGIAFVSFFIAVGIVLWYSYTFKKKWPVWGYIASIAILELVLFRVLNLGETLMESHHILKSPAIRLGNNQALVPSKTSVTLEVIIGMFLNSFYYSLVTFTTLGYGDMHPTGWLKALSAIEALTGAVFMALIVAVIARKWMR